MAPQHDDHVWIVADGGSWAIRRIWRIDRKTTVFHLWRGKAPDLEYTSFTLHNPDWEMYCDLAVAKLRKHWR
jgi:hypothetical protein